MANLTMTINKTVDNINLNADPNRFITKGGMVLDTISGRIYELVRTITGLTDTAIVDPLTGKVIVGTSAPRVVWNLLNIDTHKMRVSEAWRQFTNTSEDGARLGDLNKHFNARGHKVNLVSMQV